MNADVAILITERNGVLAIPTAALRTDRDLATSASLVGLTEDVAREQLKQNALPAQTRTDSDATDSYQFSSRYWVFVKREAKPVAVEILTGITDLDYSEVLAGLKQGDEVYMLPSSGLVETQQRFQQQMRKFTGMPGMGDSKKK